MAALCLVISSCNQKEIASGISKKDMDTLVNPGDDFDAYVNGNWNKNTKIPADKSSYGLRTATPSPHRHRPEAR